VYHRLNEGRDEQMEQDIIEKVMENENKYESPAVLGHICNGGGGGTTCPPNARK